MRVLGRVLSLVLALSLAGAGVVRAEEPCSLCWRGRTAEHCKSFLITEAGLGTRFRTFSGTSKYERDVYLIFALGYMRNLPAGNAVGGSINVDSDVGLVSVTPRYRRWLSDVFAADASAGIIVARLDNGVSLPHPGFRADLSLTLGDIISLGGGMESIPYGDTSDVAWHMESRLGSYPAAIGTGALLVTVGAVLLIILSSGNWD